jgi:hypothetical protein
LIIASSSRCEVTFSTHIPNLAKRFALDKLLPEEDRFTRLRTERKHFVDTIKMIAYRAESSMASMLREHIARSDDTRALLRQIFDTEADLNPDGTSSTLTVRLHHLT